MSKVDSNWKICLLEKIVRVFFFVIILFFLAGPPDLWGSVAAGEELLSSQLLSPLSKRTSVVFWDSPRQMTEAVAPLHSGVKSANERGDDGRLWNALQHRKSDAHDRGDWCVIVTITLPLSPCRAQRSCLSGPARSPCWLWKPSLRSVVAESSLGPAG